MTELKLNENEDFLHVLYVDYGWTINETGKPNRGAQFIITIPKVNDAGKENYRIV